MVRSIARPQPSPTRRADPCNPLAAQTLVGLGQQMDLVATPFPILTPALRLANAASAGSVMLREEMQIHWLAKANWIRGLFVEPVPILCAAPVAD